MSNSNVAQNILNQLGGKRFIVMTGTNNFVGGENYLTFHLPSRKINYIKITLNSNDLYDVEFIKIHGANIRTVSKFEDVFCDNLVEIFESETGLYTSL